MEHSLDAIDIQLLRLLQDGGRTPNAELATQVGLSPSACLRRVQYLEQAGIIAGYRAELDPRKVRLGVAAFINVTMAKNAPETMQRFHAQVSGWEEVIACYSVTGASDYLLHVVAEDLDAYARFLTERLICMELVAGVNSSLVLGTLKREGALPLRHLDGG